MNELIKYINKLNEQTLDILEYPLRSNPSKIGILTNDPDHWASYGVYTISQFKMYLEREHKHNIRMSRHWENLDDLMF
jgi:hypothetical protein